MQLVEGIYLPDDDMEMANYLRKSYQLNGKAVYQPKQIFTALEYVKNHRRALDIGAHVGTWSRILVEHFDRVEAFEPLWDHQQCFRKNVSEAMLHPYAVSSEDGVVRMRVIPNHTGACHIDDNGVSVDAVKIDDYEFDDVDFMKIDVEGHEVEVLEGAIETLKRCRPTIIVEQKGLRTDDKFAACRFLEDLSFKKQAQVIDDHIYAPA